MSATVTTIIAGVVAGVFGLLAAWIQFRKPRVDVQAGLIAEIQEERDNLKKELGELRAEVATARDDIRVAQSEAYAMQDRARMEISMQTAYTFQLISHIAQGLGPPPPPIPEELRRYYYPQATD